MELIDRLKLNDQCEETLVSIIIAIIIAAILYIFLLIATYRFLKLQSKSYVNHGILMLFYATLNVTFISRIVFYIYLYIDVNSEWKIKHTWNYTLTKDLTNFLFLLSVLFITYNWLYLIAKLTPPASEVSYELRNRVLNFSLMMIISFLALVYMFAILIFWEIDSDSHFGIFVTFRIFKAWINLSFAIVFAIVGYKLYIVAKQFHYTLALGLKFRIRFTIFLMVFPLVLRWWYNLGYIITGTENLDISEYINKKQKYVYPLFLLVYYNLVDVLPMAGQFISVHIAMKYAKTNLKITESTDFSSNEFNYGEPSRSPNELSASIIEDEDSSIYRSMFIRTSAETIATKPSLVHQFAPLAQKHF